MIRSSGHGSIAAIICDVGDVLIQFEKATQGRIERRHGVPEGSLRQVLLRSEITRLASIGQISHDEWLAQVARQVPAAAIADWLDDHGELNRGLVDFLAAVKMQGLRLFLLSNATSRLWDDLDYHGLRSLADGVYCSSNIGVAKPDPRAYKLVIEEAQVAPEMTVYVDDTASWVQAGEQQGLLGYVYGTTAGLREFLADRGVNA